MKRTFPISIIAAATIGAAAMASGAPAAAAEVKAATLYKNPQCGCCEGYAEYLRDNGYTVSVKPTHDLALMSREAGIPDEYQGCHLVHIDGYVVSGHVPVGIVDRLMSERPDIKGITLPGMPMGSPGMGGEKSEPFTVYGIADGAPEVYAVE
ncbi:DUF411 domain-containing protein [Chelativorans alearense]|uniref:DUF411 domain-containing protein n=1 Tax=Chelativorans alearense TaxID=2681495 RepID=UPI0013D5EF4F|nr:DUF411 domain-containing protein [Chelativorans alearense]